MPKTCAFCGRTPLKGNIRSHSNIATRRWQKINLQKKNIDGKKVSVCTRCLKSLYKKKLRQSAELKIHD